MDISQDIIQDKSPAESSKTESNAQGNQNQSLNNPMDDWETLRSNMVEYKATHLLATKLKNDIIDPKKTTLYLEGYEFHKMMMLSYE